MGREYTFKINKEDLEVLARNPGEVNNLDLLLKGLPYFTKVKQEDYYYSDKPKDKKRWPSIITIQNEGLSFLSYENDRILLNRIIEDLLDYCGHVDVED